MSCRGECKQGRAECDREDCGPTDPVELKIAARFTLVIVLVWVIMLIALIGALWSGA